MSEKFVLIAIFGFVFVFHGVSVISSDTSNLKNMNVLQIIKKFGYRAEGHTVKTDDGYLLELHRIPHGIKAKPPPRRPPVLIMHCIACSSAAFLLLGPSDSLAFLLADLGFDVWLGNFRGNTYSKQHVTLEPTDKSFWNFSWHESGVYDLPAMIDFVLCHTNHERLIYIGYSMGGTSFFAMASTTNDYDDKIETAFLLAPVVYLNNTKSSLVKAVAPFADKYVSISYFFTHGEAFPGAGGFRKLARTICTLSLEVCFQLMYELFGGSPKPYDKETLDVVLGHLPDGFSAMALMHFTQNLRSGDFKQYDHGPENMEIYGTQEPPDYPLENVRIPLTIFMAKNDFFCMKPDVERLVARLSTVKNVFVVDSCSFSHVDFILSETVKTDVYNQLFQSLFSHLRERFFAQRQAMKQKARGERTQSSADSNGRTSAATTTIATAS